MRWVVDLWCERRFTIAMTSAALVVAGTIVATFVFDGVSDGLHSLVSLGVFASGWMFGRATKGISRGN